MVSPLEPVAYYKYHVQLTHICQGKMTALSAVLTLSSAELKKCIESLR